MVDAKGERCFPEHSGLWCAVSAVAIQGLLAAIYCVVNEMCPDYAIAAAHASPAQ